MNLDTLNSAIRRFSLTEKLIFYGLAALFVVSGLILAFEVSKAESVEVPADGGTLTEGIVGSPRFVNPLLAVSNVDQSLVTLTYAGLLARNSDGTLSPALATSYSISTDGLTYTFTLKPGIKFSDGTPITAADVITTIQRAEDAGLNSPYASVFAGITATSPSAGVVQITLSAPYSPFINYMTIGILPQKIWVNISDENFASSQYNVRPLGEGPYVVTAIKSDSSGLPVEYDLSANALYTFGKPHISHIILKFYQNENDMIASYNAGAIDAMGGISPENISQVKRTGGFVATGVLSRVFGIFWNQSQNPVLLDPAVRKALATVLDTQSIIADTLTGYAVPLTGPLPSDTGIISLPGTTTDRVLAAQNILQKAGWQQGDDGIFKKTDKKSGKSQSLSLSLSTSDTPELKAIAEAVEASWTALGAKVSVQIYQSGDLTQSVIRPRQYDALLFGEVIPPGNDLYPFWDSAERNDPGLNVALYTNIKADKDLAVMKSSSDTTAQAKALNDFENQVASDIPAVFLYAPDFIYIVPKDLSGLHLGTLSSPSDRYDNVQSWYVQTDTVWKIFARQSSSIKN